VDLKLNNFLQARAAAEADAAIPLDQRVYADSQDRAIFDSDPFKADAVDDAETFGSIFTSIFLVMGLFSIGAGVLLIFLIFVLLAEERKTEMGIARAIGMRRWHLVETYLAEGMAYNVGSAIVGAILGIFVAFGMIAVLNTLGDDFGFSLQRHVEPRSVVVAAGVGILLVFLTVIVSAYHVSSLNIVAAIRDIPESRLVHPRRFTIRGLLADLAGLVLLGFTPVFLILGAIVAVVLAANRRAERLGFPAWARIGAMVLALGIALGLLIAILRFKTRLLDRADLNTWLLFPQFKLMLRGQGLASTMVGLLLLLPTTLVTAGLGTIAVLLPWPGSKIRRDGSAKWFVAPAWTLMRWRPEWWFSVLALGVLFTRLGINGEVAFLYLLGLSLVPIGLLLFARRIAKAGRTAHSLMGLAILVIWLAPNDVHESISGFDGDGGLELFFLSGAMMVTGGTVFFVFNLDTLALPLRLVGTIFGKLRPVVLTAAAYPATARFRTGMTVAMIAIIMFALVTFTTINSNFSRLFTSETASGGYAIQADANRNATFTDLRAAVIEEGRPDLAEHLVDVSALQLASFFGTDIVATETERWDERRERRLLDADGAPIAEEIEIELAATAFDENGDPIPGAADEAANFVYTTVLFTGANDALIDTNRILLQTRATGFDDDEAVWQALRTPLPDGSRYAIISAQAVSEAGGPFAPDEDTFTLPDTIEEETKRMPVVTALVRNPSTEEVLTVRIIGVIDQVIGITGPTFALVPSLVVADDAFARLYNDPDLVRHFAKLTDGSDPFTVAQGLEAALRVETVSILDELADLQDTSRMILGLFQGFTGLGLLAGLAALGVIAVRAVVERRQQIGMLRAIGFSRGFIRIGMVLEMSFIAFLGVSLGSVLAVVLSWRLFTEGAFGSTSGAGFYVPIGQIVLFVVIAMAASIMLTYLPARQASRITIAEALRYE
jgi:ABC-type antimicrobial peptide transport system permease subunit